MDLGNVPAGSSGVAAMIAMARLASSEMPMPPEVATYLHLVRFAVEKLGRPLLKASDADDLAARIESALEDPDRPLIEGLLAGATTPELLEQVASARGDYKQVVEAMGTVNEGRMREGMRYLKTLLQVARLLSEAHGVMLSEATRSLAAKPPLFFLESEDVHPQIAKCLLACLEGSICWLAIAAVINDGDLLPEPWLAEAIVERWVRANKLYLRLLASVPETKVPEDVIPLADRFDLGALEAEQSQANRAWQELASRAQESGAPIFPPPMPTE